MESIPIVRHGRETVHLAVRYTPPVTGRPAPGRGRSRTAAAELCFLYLHGFGSDQSGDKADFFRRRVVAAGFAFCSFDFEGHGQSGGGMRDLTMSTNLEDLSIVMAWLAVKGHERVCLIGSSMGGCAGMWYSALHPDQVIAGLHIAPALDMEGALVAWAGPERMAAWRQTGTIAYSDEMVSCELGWELIDDLRTYPAADLLSRYHTPALLLQGRLDVVVPWRGVADFVARCPYREIDLHLFADGDHRLTDRKDRIWDLMLEFLRGRRLLAADTPDDALPKQD